jgi:hypothetical protein
MLPGPWAMMGDFNECLWQSEHWSRRRRNENQMDQFRNTLSFFNLHDLGFKGKPWTYDNKQDGRNNVIVRLDRVVACPSWTKLFPNYQVLHLTSSRSDHCPILLNLDTSATMTRNVIQRRYEVFWEREASLTEEIRSAWKMHSKPKDLGDVANNLQGVMSYLHTWSKEKIGHIPRQIELKERNWRKPTEKMIITAMRWPKNFVFKLMNCWRKKKFAGDKDLGLIGSKLVIGILAISTGKQLGVQRRTTLLNSWIKMARKLRIQESCKT